MTIRLMFLLSLMPLQTVAAEAQTISADDPLFYQVNVEPRKNRVVPRYPFSCARGKETGSTDIVEVLFDIEMSGRPTNVRIVESTDSCFNRVTRKAVKKWRYTKPTLGGHAVKVLDFGSIATFRLGADGQPD